MPIPIIAAIASKIGMASTAKDLAMKEGAKSVAKEGAKTAVKEAAKSAAKEGAKTAAKEGMAKLKSIPGSVQSTNKAGLQNLANMKSKQTPDTGGSKFASLASRMKDNAPSNNNQEPDWSERESTINALTPNGIPLQDGGYHEQVDLLK